jgi:hypothetical protein
VLLGQPSQKSPSTSYATVRPAPRVGRFQHLLVAAEDCVAEDATLVGTAAAAACLRLHGQLLRTRGRSRCFCTRTA